MGPGAGGSGSGPGVYRSATPNQKGQYSDAVLNELESQNDAQVAGILGKVRVLKDVSGLMWQTGMTWKRRTMLTSFFLGG